jgi:Tol biopolymer transport system component
MSGCSSEEKVTVIKGAGISNNSLLVGLNEMCPGDVEGFTGEKLVIRVIKNNNEIEFYNIDIKTRQRNLVLSSDYNENYKFSISKDFKYAMYGKTLIDLEKNNISLLPSINTKWSNNTLKISRVPDYSFYGDHEVLAANPVIYLNRYVGSKFYGFMSHKADSRIQTKMVGDFKKQEESNLGNISVPQIKAIEDAVIDFDSGRFLFSGTSIKESKNDLYILDLFKKEFILIDTYVSLFALSPAGDSIAYIKNKDEVQKMLVCDLLSNEKKELDEQHEITGVSWSGDGRWIAYSGGENNRNDMFIIKKDGTNKEQLTQGMNSEGSIAWAQSGDKLAFTTNGSEAYKDKRVYLISLNITSQKDMGKIQNREPERQNASSEIIRLMREATQDVLKSSSKKT